MILCFLWGVPESILSHDSLVYALVILFV